MSDTVRTIRVVVDSRQAEQGADRSKRALRGLGDEANRASRMFGFLKTALIGIGTSMVIREFARLSDQAKTLNAQLLIVEGSMGKVRDRSRELVDMSIRTGTALDANVELYTKLARALQGAGYDSSKFLRVTETVSKALVLSGADAGTTSAVVRQLGQALASGSIRGDEFISVMEGAPVLMQELAKQIGKPIGELRTLAADGKLTTKTLVDAFTSIDLTSTIDRQFEMMPMTFGRAVENIKTAATVVFGEFDRGGQFSDYILNFAKFGSEDIQKLGEAAAETGEDIRVAFGALADVFRPMLEGWKAVNQAIYQDSGLLASSLTEQIAEALGILDDLANGARRGSLGLVKGAAATADLPLNILTGGKYTPLTNAANRMADNSDREWESSTLSGQYRQQVENRKNLLKLDRDRKAVAEDQAAIDAEIEAILKGQAATTSALTKEQEKAAKEAAKREKSLRDGIASLEREAELAGMIGLEREQQQAIYQLEEAAGRKLLETEKERVKTAIQLAALHETIADNMERLIGLDPEANAKARSEASNDAYRRQTGIDADKAIRDIVRGIEDPLNAEFEESGKKAGRAFRDEGLLAAEAIGQAIGGSAGNVLKNVAGVLQGVKSGDFTGVNGPLGGIMTLLSGKSGKSNPFKDGMKEALGDTVKPFKGLAKEIGGAFGANGEFTKTLGQAFGGASVGTSTDGLLKAFGVKSSKTGAQIGGAIGGATGIPGGALIGSLIGGIGGGMLKKTKWGAVDLTSVDGFSTRGNSGKAKDAANEAASSFQGGLQAIADALGADLGSFGVTLGQRHGDWRVNTNAGGSLKKKKGAVEFDDDAEGAIKYAIRDAIRDGALLGISAFSQRVLKGNTDLDKALDIATKYEQVLDALGSDANGITAAAESFAETFETLATEMRKVGATAEELANVEKLYGMEREKALKSLLDPLLDYQKGLSGEGSGVTALDRFNASKLEYEQAKADFAAGNIDQNTFTAAGQELFGLARDIFGTATSEFQSIRQQLLADSIAAIETATEAFNGGAPDKLLAAQEASNTIATQQYQQLAILNGKQDQIIAALAALHGGGAISGRYVNGVWQAAA